MVDVILVDRENLLVNQVMQFLRHRCKRQHQHVKLIQDQNLFQEYFSLVSQLRKHPRLLAVLDEQHV